MHRFWKKVCLWKKRCFAFINYFILIKNKALNCPLSSRLLFIKKAYFLDLSLLRQTWTHTKHMDRQFCKANPFLNYSNFDNNFIILNELIFGFYYLRIVVQSAYLSTEAKVVSNLIIKTIFQPEFEIIDKQSRRNLFEWSLFEAFWENFMPVF